MSKAKALAISFVFLSIITIIIDAMDLYAVSDGLAHTSFEDSLEGVGGMSLITTYWQILTFQILGLPNFITILVFYPLTLFNGAIIAEYVIALLPW